MLENHKKSVTVVIPVYNCGLLLERCLDSVFNQAGTFNIEVIVIDDGSTDNSIEIINAYPQNLTLIKQLNQGPATARNKGIEAATGCYLAFLDADDYWLPGFLTETVTFLEKHKEAIAVSVGQVHKLSDKTDTINPEILGSKTKEFVEPLVLEEFYAFWAEHNHVCTGSVLMRSEVVKLTGGQRIDLRITEDLEYWAYLATYGVWGFIPKLLFVSDGQILAKEQGWSKYQNRYASVPDFRQWIKRLDKKLTEPQRRSLGPLFNRVIEGTSRAMLIKGEIMRARKNILDNHTNLLKSNNLHVKFATSGLFFWFMFGLIYRLYQLIKLRLLPKFKTL